MDGVVRLGKMQMASVSQNRGAAGGWALMTNQNPAPYGGLFSCRDPEVRRNPVARAAIGPPDPARQQIDPLVVRRQGKGAVFNAKNTAPMFVKAISRLVLVKLSIQFWPCAQTAIEAGRPRPDSHTRITPHSGEICFFRISRSTFGIHQNRTGTGEPVAAERCLNAATGIPASQGTPTWQRPHP